MSKSIKLKNNTYIDSSSIVYGKTKLDTILNQLIPTELFSSSSGVYELGTYDLTDNITNYRFLEVYVGRGSDYGGQSVKFLRFLNGVNVLLPYTNNSRVYIKHFHLTFSGKTFTVNKVANLTINNNELPAVYSTTEEQNKIYRILGYK